jgi:hypothetical protein
MSINSDLALKLKKIILGDEDFAFLPQLMTANVVSVELDSGTCTVDTVSGGQGVQMSGVRLQTVVEDGLLLIPAVDSSVTILSANKEAPVIIQYSKLDKAYLQVGKSSLNITSSLTKFNDGSNGGLTITPELKTQLDKTNAVLQAVVDSLKNWTVAPSDGGAALKTYFATQLSSKVIGDFSNIEDKKVTH